MKLIRSRGESFTEITQEDLVLRRGILLAARHRLADTGEVKPENLDAFLREDPLLVIRQAISIIDKIYRKPTSLAEYNKDAYVNRTNLGREVWALLCAVNSSLADHEKAWKGKLHPYAIAEYDWDNPESHQNANAITGTKDLEAFTGRWFRALASGDASIQGIATKIVRHLLDDPMDISGQPRSQKRSLKMISSGREGAVGQRSVAIVSSVNDPRQPGNSKRQEHRSQQISRATLHTYFRRDIATEIHAQLTDKGRNKGTSPTYFGEALHGHLGGLGLQKMDKELWTLHNQVRTFYQRIAKSEKFRRATRNRNVDELGRILPRDARHLMNVIWAIEDNADTSALIRLGKMVVHATDLPPGIDADDPTELFKQRMDMFATSDGQAEIKRNETFTRLWRDAVGLSAQSLRAWIDPRGEGFLSPNGDEDFIGKLEVAQLAAQLLNIAHFTKHAELIFGNKAVSPQGTSRAAIFTSGDDVAQREKLWALLRSAALIRNRNLHFNTLPRTIDSLTSRLLTKEKLKTAEGQFTETQPGANNGRAGTSVTGTALESMGALLKFDQDLKRTGLQIRLDQFQATDYLNEAQIKELLRTVTAAQGGSSLTLPKFITLVRRAQAVAEADCDAIALKPYAGLDLKNLATRGGDANTCRLGVLRLLYERGFAEWIDTLDWEGDVKPALETTQAALVARQDAFRGNKAYPDAEKPLARLPLEFAEGLQELFAQIAVGSSQEAPSRWSYSPDSQQQRSASNQIENFRRDLIARLFARYVEQCCGWVWTVQEHIDEGQRIKLDDAWIEASDQPSLDHQWHAQFYAWLYLVPFDDVALLRHQIRKTLAFSLAQRGRKRRIDPEKTADESRLPLDQQRALREVDQLMGLYLEVQGAGFSGTELSGYEPELSKLFESGKQGFRLFSQDAPNHEVTYPGTQRGLRNMLRFGHEKALGKIFEKHRITSDEVAELAAVGAEDTNDRLEEKNDLRKALVDHATDEELLPDLENSAQRYRELVAEIALHRFRAQGVRLGDHARLHQLMMRVMGRLADFTAIWERDCKFAFIGLLYRQTGGELRVAKKGQSIILTWNDGVEQKLELWNRSQGAVQIFFHHQEAEKAAVRLLSEADREWFEKKFLTVPGDREEFDVKGNARTMMRGTNRRQIRNDMAHYNRLVGKDADRVNLTYLANAVRSLLAYDRKLKNAVSKSIRDIVADDGVILRWNMVQDRLKCPAANPKMESNLGFLAPADWDRLSFQVPQASLRYCSMVKALFDFDKGGLRENVSEMEGQTPKRNEDGYPVTRRKGCLRYPPFDPAWRVPDAFGALFYHPIT